MLKSPPSTSTRAVAGEEAVFARGGIAAVLTALEHHRADATVALPAVTALRNLSRLGECVRVFVLFAWEAVH
jgi:hypothetical protein